MRANTILLLCGLGGLVATGNELVPWALERRTLMNLLPRQTDPSNPVVTPPCLVTLVSVLSSAPTPPPDIIQFIVTAAESDPCHAKFPSSLLPELSSWGSEIQTWYAPRSAIISSAESECAQYESYKPSVNICTGGFGPASTEAVASAMVATTTSAALAGQTSLTSVATGSASGGSSVSPSAATGAGGSTSKGAALGETGLVIAAVAVASILGAAIVL